MSDHRFSQWVRTLTKHPSSRTPLGFPTLYGRPPDAPACIHSNSRSILPLRAPSRLDAPIRSGSGSWTDLLPLQGGTIAVGSRCPWRGVDLEGVASVIAKRIVGTQSFRVPCSCVLGGNLLGGDWCRRGDSDGPGEHRFGLDKIRNRA